MGFEETLIAALRKHVGQHKFDHGHALVLSGGVGRGGAARLAARGALRIGAGLVTLGCPPAALIENAARLDAVMLRPLRDASALRATLEDRRISAVCVGPGFGLEAREADLLDALLDMARVQALPLVLDADALTLLARWTGGLPTLPAGSVLTPHDGEFARLFPDLAAQMSCDSPAEAHAARRLAVAEAARRVQAVVLLKGARTVIAGPQGQVVEQAATGPRAAPWLATAGSGDVLAGFVTGLCARGIDGVDAAQWAAFLHVETARGFGPGLIAEDLPDRLPVVLRRLGV
ncbi:MAG: NAD(P)H-hydrate dehydratase [Rhodobacteraceae bacterium]|nr:MAG: NAD(P)H-hydrate dehydratase [Paracoccaceae bacterium]